MKKTELPLIAIQEALQPIAAQLRPEVLQENNSADVYAGVELELYKAIYLWDQNLGSEFDLNDVSNCFFRAILMLFAPNTQKPIEHVEQAKSDRLRTLIIAALADSRARGTIDTRREIDD